jgi:hypothetical protein
MIVLPEAIMLRHVNTPKDVADILAWQCKVDIPEALLRATEVGTRAAADCLIAAFKPSCTVVMLSCMGSSRRKA